MSNTVFERLECGHCVLMSRVRATARTRASDTAGLVRWLLLAPQVPGEGPAPTIAAGYAYEDGTLTVDDAFTLADALWLPVGRAAARGYRRLAPTLRLGRRVRA